MTNKPMLSVERDAFEAFWRATMNVEVMDLHRCEFPMTAYNDQPYACHETERGRLTWMARAAHDNPSSQHQGEPVAWVHPAYLKPGALGFEASVCRLSTLQVPLYTEQPVPVAVMPDVDELAQIIRKVDGSHNLGAGALAEAIHEEVSILNKMARSKADLDAGRTVSSDQMKKNLEEKFKGRKS